MMNSTCSLTLSLPVAREVSIMKRIVDSLLQSKERGKQLGLKYYGKDLNSLILKLYQLNLLNDNKIKFIVSLVTILRY